MFLIRFRSIHAVFGLKKMPTILLQLGYSTLNITIFLRYCEYHRKSNTAIISVLYNELLEKVVKRGGLGISTIQWIHWDIKVFSIFHCDVY